MLGIAEDLFPITGSNAIQLSVFPDLGLANYFGGLPIRAVYEVSGLQVLNRYEAVWGGYRRIYFKRMRVVDE